VVDDVTMAVEESSIHHWIVGSMYWAGNRPCVSIRFSETAYDQA
jgi:hypothetical protein